MGNSIVDYSEVGTWSLEDHKKSIHFTFQEDKSNGPYNLGPVIPYEDGEYYCRILKLTSNELWNKRVLSSDRVNIIHFKKVGL